MRDFSAPVIRFFLASAVTGEVAAKLDHTEPERFQDCRGVSFHDFSSSKCRIRRDKRSKRLGLTELVEVGEPAKGGESADQHSGQRKVALDTLHFGERLA